MVGEIYGKIVYKFRGGDIRLVCPQSLWENYFEYKLLGLDRERVV
jgi:hypothetical protein